MQCPICDASIDEIEADKCPACGELLGGAIFSSELAIVDDHQGGIEAVMDEQEEQSQDGSPARVAHASDKEEALIALMPEEGWVNPPHHPSTGRKHKPVKFFLFRVNLGGRVHFIWVRSTAKTPAVEQLLKWIRSKGWHPRDSAGADFPWDLSGRDLAIKYKKEMPLIEEVDSLPFDASSYIDAYYRDTPVEVSLRT